MPGDPRVQPLGPPQALNLTQPAQTLTLVKAPQNIQTTRVQQTVSLTDVTDEIIQMPSGLGGDSPAQNAIPRPPGSNLVAGPMPGDPRVQPLGPSQALNLIQPAISGFIPPPLPPSAPPPNSKFFSGNTWTKISKRKQLQNSHYYLNYISFNFKMSFWCLQIYWKTMGFCPSLKKEVESKRNKRTLFKVCFKKIWTNHSSDIVL